MKIREKKIKKKKCENKIEKSDFPTNANIRIILHGNSIYGSLIQQYTQKNQFEMRKKLKVIDEHMHR